MPRKILFAIGTRPEAIKLSPVIHHLRRSPADFQVKVCATAQQRELLDQVKPKALREGLLKVWAKW